MPIIGQSQVRIQTLFHEGKTLSNIQPSHYFDIYRHKKY